MLTPQRQDLIMGILNERGSVTVSELRDELGISESTIRRDLTAMDAEGRLTKVFGGAVVNDEKQLGATELTVSQKNTVCIEEKKLIGKTAAAMIEPGDFIYLDAGTTTGYIIDYLTCREATYVTNAVSHGIQLAGRGFHVILIGGELKGTTEAIIGGQAVSSLMDYHFTKGFFGTNGISKKFGYTTPDSSEAMVKKIAMGQCRKCYVLADNSKFGDVSSITFGAFEKAKIITDSVEMESFKDCTNIIVCEK